MRTQIRTIIFSKNRAMQLEALLRSLSLENVFVLYKCDDGFRPGYDKLIKMFPDVCFIGEISFKGQVLDLMLGEHILFLVDDDIMIRSFSEDCNEFEEFKGNEEIITLSLRMATKYDYAFLRDKEVPLPDFNGGKWEWRNHSHDWGYPMATAHIFRSKDILPILNKVEFSCPHTMEHALRRNAPDKKYALCFEEAKFINNLANQVQSKYKCKNAKIPVESLEALFVKGERIDIDKLIEKAKESRSAFMMEEYTWI